MFGHAIDRAADCATMDLVFGLDPDLADIGARSDIECRFILAD